MRDGLMNVVIFRPQKQVCSSPQLHPHVSPRAQTPFIAVGAVRVGNGHERSDKAAAGAMPRVCALRPPCSCVLQAGALPKSCLEADVKEVHASRVRAALMAHHAVRRFACMSRTATAPACFLVWTHGQMSKSAPSSVMFASTPSIVTLFQCSLLTVTAVRDALVLLIIQP